MLSPRSMRAHLLMLVVCAMVPLAILPIVGIWLQHQWDEARLRMELQRTAEVAARDLIGMLSLTDDLIRNFRSEAVALADAAPHCERAALDRLKLAFPYSTGMGILASDGAVLCSTPPAAPGKVVDRFWEASTIDRPNVAEFRPGPVTGKPVVAIAHWLSREKGRLLVVGIDTKRLVERISTLVVPNEVTLIAVDRHGVTVAGAGDRPPQAGVRFFPPAVVQRAATLQQEPHVLTGSDSVEREYAFAPVAAGLWVAAGTPTSVLHSLVNRQLTITATIIAGSGLLMFLILRIGVRRFLLEPLQVFSNAASKVASGDYSSHLGQPFATELSGLAVAFDSMTRSLEHERQRNRNAAAAFRALVEATSGESGDSFFKSFVIHAAGILDMRYALIGELVGSTKIRTLAVCDDGKLAENFTYSLEHTPCEQVQASGVCKVSRSVQSKFPKDDLLAALRVESYMGSPLRDRDGNVCGIMVVMDTRPLHEETALDALDVLRVFSSRAALEIERLRTINALEQSVAERDDALDRLAGMVQQFKALTARREKIREQERTRVAKEVHDELGQQLTLMKFEHARMLRALRAGQDAERILAEFPGIIDQAIETVRRIATELRPGILDNFGLAATLEWQAEQFSRRTGIQCRFSELADKPLDSNASTALFRIFQEALTNVARHSGAKRVDAALQCDERCVVLEVSDNGRGVDDAALRALNTTGLLGMRERAEMLGGTLVIENNSSGGAKIVATIPVAVTADAAGGVA